MFCLLRLRFRSLSPPKTPVLLLGEREVLRQLLIPVFLSMELHFEAVVSQPLIFVL